MSIATRQKDPAAVLNYTLSWADHLTELGGLTIINAVWTVPSGITQVTSGFTATTTTIRLSGGTDGQNYECLVHVTLSDTQEDEKSLLIQVRQQETGTSQDSTDRANAVSILIDLVQPVTAPLITMPELELELDRAKLASTWTPNTAYRLGDIAVSRFGHAYECIQPGTSQANARTFNDWPRWNGVTFGDGSSDPQLIWLEIGSDRFNPGFAGEQTNIYDISRAAKACCTMKMQRAAQMIDDGDVIFSQLYKHWRERANDFRPFRRPIELVRC